jgi:tetratricopeptide (TPR) repeat protein
MKTLYDLLGALPDDDAEDLRIAFRKAAKATHPDSHTSDPDAPLRFRQIVRANAILSDAEQRAAYDRLLALSRRRAGSKSKRISRAIRKLASDAIAVALLSVVSIGGYMLFQHVSKASVLPVRDASVIPVKVIKVTADRPTEIAALMPTGPSDTAGRDAPRDKAEGAAVPGEAIAPSAVVPVPSAVPPTTNATEPAANAAAPPANAAAPAANGAAPAANTGSPQAIANAGPAPDFTAHDAKSYRERGIFAYRDGDLYRALADFDLAIQIDPGFAEAYIDRSIVFYRMNRSDRAFADIAQAKRIENSNRTRTSPQASHKVSPASAKN